MFPASNSNVEEPGDAFVATATDFAMPRVASLANTSPGARDVDISWMFPASTLDVEASGDHFEARPRDSAMTGIAPLANVTPPVPALHSGPEIDISWMFVP